MRIVAGAWRGRSLVVPPGKGTRPTADRVRQALFDVLTHAEWGGPGVFEGAVVLDVFAGTGALGLEALSRGAVSACFIEQDAAALRALRANVVACRVEDRVEVLAEDALWVRSFAADHGRAGAGKVGRPRPAEDDPPWSAPGGAASLVFLDPPYGRNLVPRALKRLSDVGRIRPGALIVAEFGRDEAWVPEQPVLAVRLHGAARILVFRAA
jgi:16S rRNA (guanine966-N2)-methyltransferase